MKLYGIFFLGCFTLSFFSSAAFTDESERTAAHIGPGKAISAVSHDLGFSLSEKAKEALGIQYFKIEENSVSYFIPSSALVTYQEYQGVYRYREGWFKLLPLTSVRTSNPKLINIRASESELKSGDQIVVHGAGLLRVADLDAFGSAEAGHGH